MAENRVIGHENSIPWNIPSDQKRFREITMGHPIILGRKTHEIIGRPLPGRKSIVLTKNRNYPAEGIIVAHDIGSALAACGDVDGVFICGGGMVFHEFISLADRIYLTVIHRKYEGDVLFPEITSGFVEVGKEEIADTPPYSFAIYERKIMKP